MTDDIFYEMKSAATEMSFAVVMLIVAPRGKPELAQALFYKPGENEETVRNEIARLIEHERLVPLGYKAIKALAPGLERFYDFIFEPYEKNGRVVAAFRRFEDVITALIREKGIYTEIIPETSFN